MHLEPEHLKVVQKILYEHVPDIEVWAFGSRVHGQQLKKFSDLDLVLRTESSLPLPKFLELKDVFAESSLPFRVDLVDWSAIGSDFRKIIQSHYFVLKPPPLSL